MNILLVTSAAPMRSAFSTVEKKPPLGLGTLISLLRERNYKVFFIDNYLTPSNFIEVDFLQMNNIDYIGIYSNTICFSDTLRMFTAINNLRAGGKWNGKIIVGGPHVSVGLETIPEYVDYVVQGEGENALLSIIEGREKDRIVKNKRIEDIDYLPFQPWDIFSRLQYDFSCEWFETKPVFPLNTSRGCPFHCNFCSVGAIWGNKYTFFTPDRIIAEIEFLVNNFGAKGIYFREDNFTFSRSRVEEFCRKLVKKNLRLDWACESRVETLCDERLVREMSKSGCRAVYLGVESGSQRMLDILDKKIKVKQIENAINLCKKYNIRAYCSLIAGVPGETYQDYLMTIDLMQNLKPYKYSFNIFVGLPGSKLYDRVLDSKQYEFKDENGLLYLPGFHIKSKYFYGIDSHELVDYNFQEKTDYDLKLLSRLRCQRLRNYIDKCIPNAFKVVK